MHVKFSNKNLCNKFKGLYRQNSKELNNEFFFNFIHKNINFFIDKWNFLMNPNIINKLKLIAIKYDKIQNKLSGMLGSMGIDMNKLNKDLENIKDKNNHKKDDLD